jgi:hypothetical protein
MLAAVLLLLTMGWRAQPPAERAPPEPSLLDRPSTEQMPRADGPHPGGLTPAPAVRPTDPEDERLHIRTGRMDRPPFTLQVGAG